MNKKLLIQLMVMAVIFTLLFQEADAFKLKFKKKKAFKVVKFPGHASGSGSQPVQHQTVAPVEAVQRPVAPVEPSARPVQKRVVIVKKKKKIGLKKKKIVKESLFKLFLG